MKATTVITVLFAASSVQAYLDDDVWYDRSLEQRDIDEDDSSDHLLAQRDLDDDEVDEFLMYRRQGEGRVAQKGGKGGNGKKGKCRLVGTLSNKLRCFLPDGRQCGGYRPCKYGSDGTDCQCTFDPDVDQQGSGKGDKPTEGGENSGGGFGGNSDGPTCQPDGKALRCFLRGNKCGGRKPCEGQDRGAPCICTSGDTAKGNGDAQQGGRSGGRPNAM